MSNIMSEQFFSQARRAGALILTFCMIALIGCGSTKVYTADKTMIYRDDLYNMSNVQRIGSRVDGKLENGEVVNLRDMERKQIENLLKENDEILVSMIVEMDDKEMVYLRSRVQKYSEYSNMAKRFERANKDIAKFMGNKKSTQLKLK